MIVDTVEAALAARLKGDAGLAAMVEDRVYELIAPQGARRPFVTLQEISASDPAQTMDGPSTLLRSVYQVDVYADGPMARLTARQAGRQIRAALDGYTGDPAGGDNVIKSVLFSDRRDIYDDVALHRVSTDFTVWSEGAP